MATFTDNFEQAVEAITSPQIVQAFLVGVFAIVAAALVLQGIDIPDTVSNILFAIVGFYFADSRGKQAEQRVREAVRRTDELTAYAQRMGLHGNVEPTDAKKLTTSENVIPAAIDKTAHPDAATSVSQGQDK